MSSSHLNILGHIEENDNGDENDNVGSLPLDDVSSSSHANAGMRTTTRTVVPEGFHPEEGGRDDVSLWRQTVLLAAKNWTTKRRSDWKKLLGELLLPVFYLVILSYLVRLDNRKAYPEVKDERVGPTNVLNSLEQTLGQGPFEFYIVHSSNSRIDNLTNFMKTAWEGNSPSPWERVMKFLPVNSLQSLMDDYAANSSKILWAIVLSESDTHSYTIKTNTDHLVWGVPSPFLKTVGLETCRELKENSTIVEGPTTCPVNGYYYSHFSAIQYLVDQALIMEAKKDSENYIIPVVEIQNYPTAAYVPGMSSWMRIIIPVYCVIPLAQLINTLLMLIVTEKENKVKDGFKMIGVSDIAYWGSWFAIYGTMAVIFSIMFTIVMHFMNILKNINVVILLLLFMLFGFSIITFSFALTPFFDKPKTAGAVGTLVMQLTGILFILQTFLLDTNNNTGMIPLMLISSVAFTTALDKACAFEFQGGISASDILPGGKASGILYSLIFLAFDTVLYGLLAIYLDNVIASEQGVRKHPLYFLSPSFWVESRRNANATGLNYVSTSNEIPHLPESEDVEKVHPSLLGKEAFVIRGVSKTYNSSCFGGKGNTEALKDISMDIYDGQITAIIGRNGAGKSTLINIMTGLVNPTQGKCIVFGLDTSNPADLNRLRKMTGVCLQQDLLFPTLTAKEHLELYGKLRGVRKLELASQITKLLHELELSLQESTRADKLSGGQRRKLSIAVALIGSPKILLLDEPSAGIDALSRRRLWSLLQSKKSGRAILLTTHFMDEADILADRKAVIHNGTLKCVGSSLFLKNRFGVGYQLTIELREVEGSTRVPDELIERLVPAALPSRQVVASEVKYTLPHVAVAKFPQLFGELENLIAGDEGYRSGLLSYGVSMTTLSEVFLKISNDIDVQVPGSSHEPIPHRRRMSRNSNSSNDSLNAHPIVGNSGSSEIGNNLIRDIGDLAPNWFSTFKAMCVLRFRRLLRNPQALFFTIVMPVILVIIGFGVLKAQSGNGGQTSVTFSSDEKSSFYPGVGIAVNDASGDIAHTLMERGLIVHNYSGRFPDLLDTNQPEGTMAAVNTEAGTGRLSALIRINGTFLHSPGIIQNAISQFFSNDTVKITTINEPFPSQKLTFSQGSFGFIGFLVAPVFTFAAVGMVMEIVNDREKHTRNHLRVNGLSFTMYFSSMLFVFGLMSLFITVMEIIAILIFNVPAFSNPYALTATACLVVLFILPCLLFSAAFSYLFNKMETAQTLFSTLAYWMGFAFGFAIIMIDLLAPDHSFMLHTIFSFLNVFYIPYGIFYFVQRVHSVCLMLNTCESLSFASYTGREFGIMVVAMLVQIPVFGLALVLAEFLKGGNQGILGIIKSCLGIKSSPPRKPNAANEPQDDDVESESTRVGQYFEHASNGSNCVVAVKDLQKSYPVKKSKSKESESTEGVRNNFKDVVKGLNLMVEEGEVFGLLGHNGAGKTTTMRLIIAEESPDSGKIHLCGHDVQSNMSNAFLKLGYCPQHDALWENITLEEHIELYATIRGIHPNIRKRTVDHFLSGLQIGEHAQKRASALSGGTKRKLSYCLSILGAPRIVLLDEPSTGMDIVSKRFLWNTVIGTFKDNRGAILTTHSMEEADALCTRIAIMVEGSLHCIGSPQHLKSKFGVGYQLEIKLKMEEEEEDEANSSHLEPTSRFDFIKAYFPSSSLTESFENRAVFTLPKTSVSSVPDTFALLEKLKEENNIEEYSFSQTTLEQIFLQFAQDAECNSDDQT